MREWVRQFAVIFVALALAAATFSAPRAEAAQTPQPPAPQPAAPPAPPAPPAPATPPIVPAPSTAPVAPVQTFTFDQAVQATLTHNPQVVAAEQSVVSAQQNVLVAKAGYGPTVSLNGNGAYGTTSVSNASVTSPSGVFTVPLTSATGTGTATVTGQITVFDNGHTRVLVESAQAALASAQATLRTTEQALALQAGTQFFTVLGNEGVAAADQQVLAQNQALLALVEAQVRAGVAPQADVIQSQSQVAQAQVALINAEAQILTAKAALASTMGTDTTAPIEVVSPAPPSPQVTVAADEVLAAALQNRPEIAQANAAVSSAQAGLDTAYVNAGPQVNIVAAAGVTPVSTEPSLNNTQSYAVTGTISVPLFDSGKGHAEIAAAQASLKSARASLDSTILSVRQDAYTSYLLAVQAAANLSATQAAKAAADQALAVAQGQYRAGVGTIVAVIQAQTTAAQADVNAAAAVYNYQSALVTLQHAEGAPIVAHAGGGTL